MRICTEYEQLTPQERQKYIGGLIHCCITSPELFKEGKKIIEYGEHSGLFDGVIINPTTETGQGNNING